MVSPRRPVIPAKTPGAPAENGAGRAALFAARPAWCETSFAADKPDSVRRDHSQRGLHFSQHPPKRTCPAPSGLRRPGPDATNPGLSDGPPSPLFSLAPDWVFRAAAVAGARGGLLPHLFTLAARLPARRFVLCDTVRRGALTRRARPFARNPALWCPDFPLRIQ